MSWGGTGHRARQGCAAGGRQDSPEAALGLPLAIPPPAALGYAVSCPESLWGRCQGSAPRSGVLWVVQAASESSHNVLKLSADGKMGFCENVPRAGRD